MHLLPADGVLFSVSPVLLILLFVGTAGHDIHTDVSEGNIKERAVLTAKVFLQ